MKKSLSYLKPYTIYIVIAALCVSVQAISNLILPNIMADIIDEGIVKQSIDNVYQYGLTMLYITLGAMVFNILAVYMAARVSSGYSKDLREALYKKVESFSLSEFDKFSTSSLITRTVNDISQIQNMIGMVIRMVFLAPVMCIGGIYFALTTNVDLSVIFLIIIPIIVIFIILIALKVIPLFTKYQKYLDNMNQVIREKLTGVRTIRSFNKEGYERDRYEKANKNLYDVSLKTINIMAFLMPVVMFTVNISSALIIWFGVPLIEVGSLQIGDMMAFIQYAMLVLFSILMASMMFVMIPRAIVSLKRINEVLVSKPNIKNGNKKDVDKGVIEFRNVSFSFENSKIDAVSNVSFKINQGENVAIIGPTGSSKTTLLNLLFRFYDVTKGEILINGVNIKEFDMNALREKISYLPQKNYLFSASIKDNIKYGNNNASLEKIEKVSKIADAFEFINKLDEKFDATVTQGGTNFSGGQKQRIGIARTLIKDADIYVFDDSFSALDYSTDRRVRDAINKEYQGKTKITVAQRVATVMNADKIILLDDGKVIGIGTHKELYKNNEEYKNIVLSQVTKEEAEHE